MSKRDSEPPDVVPYSGRIAQLYDLFYAEKPYDGEAGFVARRIAALASRRVHRILDVACGTGGHVFALERLGFEVTGVDASEGMVARATEKAAATGSAATFRRADMRSLPPPGEPFDAVISLFDSIGFAATNEGLRATLAGMRRQLYSGGLLVLEMWHAAALLRHYEPVRVRRWTTEEGSIIRISETTLECDKQLAHVHYSLIELLADGTWRRTEETQTNRYFLVQEMTSRLEEAGFEVLEWFAGFGEDMKKIDTETWHLVVIARSVEDRDDRQRGAW